jgi:hypothetical protein
MCGVPCLGVLRLLMVFGAAAQEKMVKDHVFQRQNAIQAQRSEMNMCLMETTAIYNSAAAHLDTAGALFLTQAERMTLELDAHLSATRPIIIKSRIPTSELEDKRESPLQAAAIAAVEAMTLQLVMPQVIPLEQRLQDLVVKDTLVPLLARACFFSTRVYHPEKRNMVLFIFSGQSSASNTCGIPFHTAPLHALTLIS